MTARKEITYRFRGHGATWGLWARLDATLHTDGFAFAIEKGRTRGWAVGGQERWLVEVHRYTTTPTDSDENTPALAMYEFLEQVLGPAAVEPVVSYDRKTGTYCVNWPSTPPGDA